MLKRAAFVLITLAVLSLGLLPSGASAQTPPPETSSLLVKLVSGLTAEEQAAVIARNGGTETSAIAALRLHVVQVPTVELADTTARYEADPQVQHVEENRVRRSEMLSNDEHAVSQWALPQIGWDLVFGTVAPTGTAKVAILDSGINAAHPDLAGRVVPGTSILDGSNGLSDSNGHGTWVAGIVAANTDNAIGIAGIAFAGVQLMPVTVLDANGEGRDSDVIAGVIWAADHGADVILMAFSNPGFSPNLQDAIDYAWSRGAVLVAAVGNDAAGTPTFPAGDRGVIGVSGTDQADALLGYSNYGKAAFLAAPGESIATTDLNGDYVAVSGTSSSAAIVAGVAAFLKAVDPTLTNGMIVGRMARTADPAGTQDQTGNGRVNMARALEDTGTDEIQPAGADPIGDGGPFVGPYRAANTRTLAVTFGGTGAGEVEIKATKAPADIVNLGGCSGTGSGTATAKITATCSSISITTASGNPNYTLTATPNGSSSFVNWSFGGSGGVCGAGIVTTNPCVGTNVNNAVTVTVTFNALKLAITSVNGGANPTFGTPFSVVVQSQNSASSPTNVSVNTNVTLSVNTGTGTLGGTVTGTILAGTNSVTISGVTYSKAENGVVLTASSGSFTPGNSASFNVQKADQTITVTTAAPGTAVYNTTFNVAATASSSLSVAITTTGVCSVDSGGSNSAVIKMTSGAGTCTVHYNQAGDANYNAAPEKTSDTTAQKADQTITVTTAAPGTAVYNTTFNVAATGGGSGNAVVITATGVCSVDSGGSNSAVIKMTSGAGTCTVHYNQAGDANYNAAPEKTSDTTAQKADQTITVTTAAPGTAVYNTTFNVAATGGGSGNAVVITATGVCSVDSGGSNSAVIKMTSGTGTCTVHYNQAGNGNYNAAPEKTSDTTAQKADQTITVTTAAPGTAVYNTTFNVAATASSSLSVAITTTGVCSVDSGGSNSAVIKMTSGTGTCTVHYNQAGDANYNAAPEKTSDTTAQKADQTITVTAAAPGTAVYNTTFNVAATGGGSGNAVVITATGVCSVDSGGSNSAVIKMTSGMGTCTVHYNQAGNGNYNAAPEKTSDTTAQKADQTITVTTAAPGTAVYNTTFNVAATGGGSGNAVVITATGVCSVDSGGSNSAVIKMTSGMGTCTVHYNQAGNGNYNAAPEKTSDTTAQKADQTITFGALADKYFLDPNFVISATASSGLTVGFTSLTTPVCTVSGTTVDVLLAGYCTIRASQLGNANYNPAPNEDRTFTVTGYNFTGFFHPIDNFPTENRVKAGQAIPIKFSLSGYQGMGIFMAGYPISYSTGCNGAVDDIEVVDTPGASGLTYDPGSDQYHYVWKTDKSWGGTCRRLVVKLADGSEHVALFSFTK